MNDFKKAIEPMFDTIWGTIVFLVIVFALLILFGLMAGEQQKHLASKYQSEHCEVDK